MGFFTNPSSCPLFVKLLTLKKNTLSSHHALTHRSVTKLLEDLVYFVVDIPSSAQDVLEITVNKPNRERQKLMREQNILKQVHIASLIGFSFQTSH